MELEAALIETLGNRYADTTVSSQNVGVKHWILFNNLVLHSTEYLLFTQGQRPSPHQVSKAEYKLLLFAMYLAKDYPGRTVSEYVYHVRAKHFQWLNFTDIADMGVVFSRLPLLLRILKKKTPGVMRSKKPFTKSNLQRLWSVCSVAFHRGDFEVMLFWITITTAFQQLLRLNEIVTMPVKSQANKFPISTADLTFFDVNGNAIQHPDSKAQAWQMQDLVAYATIVAPPTKADAEACNEPYYLPMSAGEARFICPCWALWQFLAAFPMPLLARQGTALFRSTGTPFAVQSKFAQYLRSFKKACRAANIQYSGYGKHCYRVGGLNALQDAGCTMPQLMAMGHWKSDAWMAYSRRQHLSLMHFNNLMLR